MTDGPGVTVRPATVADASALARCFEAAYAPLRARIADLPDVAGGMAEAIAEHTAFVAECDGRIAGGLFLQVDGDRAQLVNVAVRTDAAGRGIGRALIDAAVARCRATGVATLDLATHAELPDNVALYKRLGWHVAGRDGNKVRMRRTI